MRFFRTWTGVTAGLFAAGLLLGALRWHYAQEPLHTDLTTYALVGHALLQGGELYRTVVDMKPPGIYLLFAAAEAVAGPGPETIVGLGIVFSLASMALIFIILRSLAGAAAGWLGVGFWLAASSAVRLHANLPTAELFLNTFLLAAMAGMLAQARGKPYGAWLAGAGLGVASLIKTNVLFYFLAYALYLGCRERGKVWGSLLRLAAPAAGIWAGVLGAFAFQGRLADLWDIVFRALLHYAGNGILNEWRFATAGFFHQFPGFLEVYPLWLLSGLWLLLNLFRRAWGETAWLGACFLGGLGMVGSLANGYIIYYQVLLPALVIMASLAVVELAVAWRPAWGRITAVALTLASLGYLGGFVVANLRLPLDAVSRLKYGPGLENDRRLAGMLAAWTDPREKIYQWGMASGLYYYSGRAPASGLILHHLLYFSPADVKQRLQAKVKADLAKDPPAFFILTAWSGDYRENEIFRGLESDYRFFGCYDKYLIFERRERPLRPAQVLIEASTTMPDQPWRTPVIYRGPGAAGEAAPRLAESPRQDDYGRRLAEGNRLARENRWPEALDAWVAAHHADLGAAETKANQGVYYERTGEAYMALAQYQIAAEKIGPPWDAVYRDALLRLVALVRRQER